MSGTLTDTEKQHLTKLSVKERRELKSLLDKAHKKDTTTVLLDSLRSDDDSSYEIPNTFDFGKTLYAINCLLIVTFLSCSIIFIQSKNI